MDVYLVPTGPERFELYCESAEDPPVPNPEASSGLFRRLHERFSRMLVAVEHEYERELARIRANQQHSDGFWRRLRARGVRGLAERVAEQRLLWRLRGRQRARALYPAYLDDARALAEIRRLLQSDADRHLRWLVVDGVALLVSGLLTPLPGPNVASYYFTFRVVGHLLAVRGARQGLRRVEWELAPSPALAELSQLGALPAAEQIQRVRAVERELGLSKLARFFERIAVRTA